MEELGGLIRPMAVTAFCFLIGAIAISGLPPLNGFVSEWLTYQSLLAGFGVTGGFAPIPFPPSRSLLAPSRGPAAAAFFESFSVTLPSPPPRREPPRPP